MHLFAFVLVSCHFKWKLFGANRPSFTLKNNTRKKIRKTKYVVTLNILPYSNKDDNKNVYNLITNAAQETNKTKA